MAQQSADWVTLAVALGIGGIILLRNMKATKERRSCGQWVILLLYKFVRFLWVVVRGVDVGYLEYRRALRDAPLEIENELQLGKLVKASDRAVLSDALTWEPVEN